MKIVKLLVNVTCMSVYPKLTFSAKFLWLKGRLVEIFNFQKSSSHQISTFLSTRKLFSEKSFELPAEKSFKSWKVIGPTPFFENRVFNVR